jgi:hypothetical protein
MHLVCLEGFGKAARSLERNINAGLFFKQDMETLTATQRRWVGRTGREGSRFIVLLVCVALSVVSILPASLNNTQKNSRPIYGAGRRTFV